MFIHSLIARVAKKEFTKSLKFDESSALDIPLCSESMPRLLYLHVPFCEQLCPYCSFNRYVYDKESCLAYFRSLRREMLFYKDMGYDFSGVYAGGGTPTILIDELLETLTLAKSTFSIREISVETNPNHLTQTNISLLKQAGVNRLSVGVQSFDDGLLKAMGRYEKYGSGRQIAERLQDIVGAFDTLNADMIFNFPTQTMEILHKDIDTLLKTGIDQITYYPLMVSDMTKEVIKETLGEIDYRKERKFYRCITERLLAGYRFSSAWCFSKNTSTASIIDEYIVDYEEYAGLGSGSIGYLSGVCYANTFDVRDYTELLDKGVLPVIAVRNFSRHDRVRYDFLMRLFGTKLNAIDLKKKYGEDVFKLIWKDLAAFTAVGALRYWDPDYYLTRSGCYIWVIMMREFFTAVNNFRDYCRALIPAASENIISATVKQELETLDKSKK